jgi:hypothetical protein
VLTTTPTDPSSTTSSTVEATTSSTSEPAPIEVAGIDVLITSAALIIGLLVAVVVILAVRR